MIITIVTLSTLLLICLFKINSYYHIVKIKNLEIRVHQERTTRYEKDFAILTIELKDIMSLNKLCIDKWEKAVLDNTNLNQTIHQLSTYLENNYTKK